MTHPTSVHMCAGEPDRPARLSRALTHPKVVGTMVFLPSIMRSIYLEGAHGSAWIWVADREDHRITDATSWKSTLAPHGAAQRSAAPALSCSGQSETTERGKTPELQYQIVNFA